MSRSPLMTPATLTILVAEEADLQQFRATGTSRTIGRPGTRHQRDETARRLAIIAQMRDLYAELRRCATEAAAGGRSTRP